MAKRLPYSAEVKMAEWLLAGKQRHPNKDDAAAHKQMFDAAWRELSSAMAGRLGSCLMSYTSKSRLSVVYKVCNVKVPCGSCPLAPCRSF